MLLLELNADCLLQIFSYCEDEDLRNIGLIYSELNDLIEKSILQKKASDLLICAPRFKSEIFKRTRTKMSTATRLKIAQNWLNGIYGEQKYLNTPTNYVKKVALDRDWFYFLNHDYIRIYKRLDKDVIDTQNYKEIKVSDSDMSDLVKKNDTIFAGYVNGCCYIYENGHVTAKQLHPLDDILTCLDFTGDIYASSSEKSAIIWRRRQESGSIKLDLMKDLKEAFTALRLNYSGDLLFGGLHIATEKGSLVEIDLKTGYRRLLNSKTLYIRDLIQKDENTVLTANFDKTLRLYDRRSNRDEVIWREGFHLSSIEYDGINGVLCGTEFNARVNLYDLRVHDRHINSYHLKAQERLLTTQSSVYSLTCDTHYLFAATDYDIHVLDFKVDDAPKIIKSI